MVGCAAVLLCCMPGCGALTSACTGRLLLWPGVHHQSWGPIAFAERYAHQMLEEDDDEGSFDEDRESDSEEEGEESDFSVSGDDSDEEDHGGEATSLRCWCACLEASSLQEAAWLFWCG